MRHFLIAFALVAGCVGPALAQPAPSPSPAAAGSAADAAAPAEEDTDASSAALGRERIVAMLKNGSAEEEWFAPTFLAEIPIASVNAVISEVLTAAGDYKSVQKDGAGTYKATFTHGTDVILIKFTKKKIDYLLFKPVR